MGESASILIAFNFQRVPKKTQISWTVEGQGIEEGRCCGAVHCVKRIALAERRPDDGPTGRA